MCGAPTQSGPLHLTTSDHYLRKIIQKFSYRGVAINSQAAPPCNTSDERANTFKSCLCNFCKVISTPQHALKIFSILFLGHTKQA